MKQKTLIIIGSGFGGLATAALLGKQGYKVTVLEKNNQVGGRASVYKEKGFTFDMGPSWYLMPEVFEKFFKQFKKKPSDFYSLKRLDPSYRIFLENNKHLDISSDLKKNIQLFESLEKNGGIKLEKYLAESKYKYQIAMQKFIYKEYRSIFDLIDISMLFKSLKLQLFESIDRYVGKFFRSDVAKKILLYTTVFLGGDPKTTPALYSLMAHVDFNLGVWFPKGGMTSVVKAMYDLCVLNNVTFKLNHEVTKFEYKDNKIKRVYLKNKGWIEADIIISNADYAYTETKLLDAKYQSHPEKYWQGKTIAPSAFLIYLGIKGKVKNLAHHNLFLETDWQKHFDTIFRAPSWPKKFSYYLSCPSKTDKTLAPSKDENIFVLVPIAAGLKDTEALRESFYTKIIQHVESITKEKIQDRVLVKKLFTVKDFEKDYNSYQGTALGLSHTLFQSAVFRPQIKSKKLENLYYVGQYLHPGIGVPMVIISAEIVANKIVKEYANS